MNNNILQGVRPSLSSKHISSSNAANRFIIKSKQTLISSKQNPPRSHQNLSTSQQKNRYHSSSSNPHIDHQYQQSPAATNQNIEQFLKYMIERSKKFQQLMSTNAILNQQAFCQKHLFGSTCIVTKTILKSVLDKLISDKRLGKNLKGMNKSNMIQIQNAIWQSIEREVALYQNERKYTKQRDELKAQIENRKAQILKDLKNVSLRYQAVEKQLAYQEEQGKDMDGSRNYENHESQDSIQNQFQQRDATLSNENTTTQLVN